MMNEFKIYLVGCLLLASFAAAAPPVAEQLALRDFFDAIPRLAGEVNWFQPGYSPDDMCTSWVSLRCINDSISVISLPYSAVTGYIPNSIGNLTNLQIFDIDGNRLNGTIPAVMANLPLKTFRIEGNLFTSPFPVALLSIPTLEEVSLQGTLFQDPWPSNWSSSILKLYLTDVSFSGPLSPTITSMTNLRVLDFRYNDDTLNGTAPDFLFTMSSLEELYLSSNSFRDPLPDLCGLRNLRIFTADQSVFTNYTMPDLGCLRNLTNFECRACNLVGTFPTGFASTNLSVLHLDGNALTGAIPQDAGLHPWKSLLLSYNSFSGTVPFSIWNSSTLQHLILGGNPDLTGTIPSGIAPASLIRLDISDSQFSGPLPVDIGNWPNLQELHLRRSPLFNSSIPSSIGNLANLYTLDLSYCSGMSGPLPTTMGSLRLTHLRLTNTSVAAGSSSLSIIFNISTLQTLHLANNGITGTIPESLGNLKSVKELVLYGNLLTGSLPASIRNLRSLEALDIRQNFLNGSIPTSLSYILTPTVIYLSANQFTGCFDQPTVISDPEKCDIDASLCGCTSAGCKVAVCPLTASSVCVGAKPVPTAECKNGIWVIPSTITVSGGQVVIQNPTLIGGDLVILTANSTLSLSPTGLRPDLMVAGCVSFNGTIVINLNSSLLSPNTSRVDLLTHSGFCGGSTTPFSSVNVQVDCGSVNGVTLDYQTRSLSLAFNSFDSSSCNTNGVVSNSQTLAIIIGCSVAGGVILFVIIVLIIAFNVPAVGNRIMPWRARRNQMGVHDDL